MMNVVFSTNPVTKEVVVLDAADGRLLSSIDTRYQGGPLLPGVTAYASQLGGRFADLKPRLRTRSTSAGAGSWPWPSRPPGGVPYQNVC
ncbi:hypothetical protein ACIBQ1_32775 [Nonomuraea sp. NPDC050153]|uniref:hypothetical protein n=1 Tax=Nonomuraea sp. NPDC050153 TaxID=3364359 RepID=UPI00379E6010